MAQVSPLDRNGVYETYDVEDEALMQERPWYDRAADHTASTRIEKPPRADDPEVIPDPPFPISRFDNLTDLLLNARPVPVCNSDLADSGPHFLETNPMRQHRYLTGPMRAGVIINHMRVRHM